MKHKVYLIPTEGREASNIGILPNRGLLYSNKKEFGLNPRHIYITSDEKIKQGDWYIWLNRLYQATSLTIKQGQAKSPIIATTDAELWSKTSVIGQEGHFDNKPLPKIPQSFIEIYIKAYNEGKQILEVELECEESKEYLSSNGFTVVDMYIPERLKLTDKGEVIIKPLEEKLYTRADLWEAYKYLYMMSLNISDFSLERLEKLFNMNYPK